MKSEFFSFPGPVRQPIHPSVPAGHGEIKSRGREGGRNPAVPRDTRFVPGPSGGRRTTDCVVLQSAFGDKLLQDIADGLHVFFTSSSWRVSWMNLPRSSTFFSTESARCFSRHLGMPRAVGGMFIMVGGQACRTAFSRLPPGRISPGPRLAAGCRVARNPQADRPCRCRS